jgi:hypothetical protein
MSSGGIHFKSGSGILNDIFRDSTQSSAELWDSTLKQAMTASFKILTYFTIHENIRTPFDATVETALLNNQRFI